MNKYKISDVPITQVPVNLYDYQIKNETDEKIVERTFLGQILYLLKEKKYEKEDINTIFLNKVIYFSAREIEKTNSKLGLSKGWYKYGPCYEAGRLSEQGLTKYYFKNLKPIDCTIPEIEKTFGEEIGPYIGTIKHDERFFYHYLDHIYRDRQEYKELNAFYLTKNDLSYNAFKLAYNGDISAEKFRRNLIDFEKAIIDKKYLNFIGMKDKHMDLILKATSLIGEPIIKYSEIKDKLDFDPILDNQIKNMALVFDTIIQMPFAYKNYYKTFETNNSIFRGTKRDELERNFGKSMELVENKIRECLAALAPYSNLIL